MTGLNVSKILGSVALIAFTGAVAVSATGAFFSDTETSTGNTFTAGAIDLTVDNTQHYNNAVCTLLDGQATTSPGYYWMLEPNAVVSNPQYPAIGSPCDGTWTATDLGPTHQFFDFNDVKPGDTGEDTISLHVTSNEAYACVDIAVTSNDDVTCTEPENELGAENGACQNSVPSAAFDGELAQNLDFFAWADTGATPGYQGLQDVGEGDNIWQANELPLFSNVHGPLSDAIPAGKTYSLATPSLGALPAGSTSYIGLEWCAGTFTVGAPGSITCSGSSMGNVTQTDSATANVTFRVEQARNNPNFTCTPPIL